MPQSGDDDWQRLSPLAMLFFAGSTVKHVVRGLQAAILPWLALFLTMRDDPGEMRAFVIFLWVFAGLIALSMATYAVTQWVCFRFRIAADRLLILRGFIKKSTLDMPFDRVQGMNIERSLVDRIVGLVTVTLDTSGSAQAEGRLPSLRTEVADRLRARVARRRRELDADGAGQRAHGGDEPGEGERDSGSGVRVARAAAAASRAADWTDRGRMLLRLGPGDMIRIGLANRNFIVVAAIAGILADLLTPGPGLEPILEALGQRVESAAGTFSALGAFAQVALASIVLAVFLGAAFVLTVAAAFLRHHDFTLWHSGSAIDEGTFRSRAGLLTQREVVVRSVRIQQLAVSQDLVLRCFGKFRMRALPAATLVGQGGQSPAGMNLAEVLEVPILNGDAAEELRAVALGREAREIAVLPRDSRFERVSPWFVRALALRIWLVAGAALGFVFADPGSGSAWVWSWLIWWLGLALPVAALAGWQLWRRRGYLHDDDGLACRRGFLGMTVDACLMRKVQSVALKQSPLQRRKGLATVVVRLACGKIAAPYVEERRARRLCDHILYRVESSGEGWH